MKPNESVQPIPELGAVLKFLLDCFDIRRDGNRFTHKQVERLAKGKNQSKETAEKVARAVVDAIYRQLTDDQACDGMTSEALTEWAQNPRKFSGLTVDAKGTTILPRNQLLKDLVEFCWRHQFLLASLEDNKDRDTALYYWLSGFVIPFIASTLVDYYFTGNNPESGMPSGRLWYLPAIETTQDPDRPYRLVMPSQQVLRWWEDLLGKSLESFHRQLGGPTSDPESARRKISAWKQEAQPPDSETIRRWTNQTWDYLGTFRDTPDLPLKERWGRCRVFLENKGMTASSNWIDGVASSPFDPTKALAQMYRGERLEQEIAPFGDTPFKRFFESADPVADGLPVEELLRRVAVRWRQPTRLELHFRLSVGRAMNVAWHVCSKAVGSDKTLDLIRWAGCAYNHFMTLAIESEKLSAPEGMRIHSRLADPADPAFYPIAAMLDQGYWLGLPGYLRMWIRGEDAFKQ